MRAVGYIRVSTKRQAAEGESLPSQAADFDRYCQREGLEPYAVCWDVMTGATAKRSGLQLALRLIRQRRAQLLVVSDLDRAFRSELDAHETIKQLERYGADIRGSRQNLDRSSPEGQLVFSVLAAVAAWERRRIGERMRHSSRFKRSRGEAYCPAPALGERFEKQIVPGDGRSKMVVVAEEEELKVVARILRLRSEGKSFRQIARLLARDHIPTKKGKDWHASTIREICKRQLANERTT